MVQLEEFSAHQTIPHYHTRAGVGGEIARPGAGLPDGGAEKLAKKNVDDFNTVARNRGSLWLTCPIF